MSRSSVLASDDQSSVAFARWTLWFRVLGFLLCTLLASSLTAQIHTASLLIVVSAEDQTPLPGVSVEVVNSDRGLARSAITDDSGSALVRGLPPGPYEVDTQLDGMASLGPQKLTLIVGQRGFIAFVMQPQVSDVVTVTGEAPMVDVFRVQSSTNVIPEQIQSLPNKDRKYEHLAFITPGVQRDRQLYFNRTGAPVPANSSNAGLTQYLVDGVDYTDPFMGLSRIRFGTDAIREFQVLNTYGSEIGPSSGGAISIITNSGSNRINGSVFGFYGADALRGSGALELEDADFSTYQLGFAIGGPINLDRTHYFASLEYTNAKDTALFRPGGAFLDLAGDVPNPVDQTLGLLSLDHSFSASSTATLKVNYERKREDNYAVGGVKSQANGWTFNRDGWNLLLGTTWLLGETRLNEARLQTGQRQGEWAINSLTMTEWFSVGSTLQDGGDTLGEGCADDGRVFELRDTFFFQVGGQRQHQMKAGVSWERLDWTYRQEDYQFGFLIYETDDRSLPLVYYHGVGSSDINRATDLVGAFVQDDWLARENLTLSLGIRYDYDTKGNNPDFAHTLLPDGRSVDNNNLQARFGFNWDMTRDGRNLLRGGIGRFTGRNLFLAMLWEWMTNDETGRATYRNLNGGIPELWLDPSNPLETGVPLPPDITVHDDRLENAELDQLTLGYSRRLGSTNLVLDLELAYSEGRKEYAARDSNWGGNQNPVRYHPEYFTILSGTNEGRSRFKLATLGLNGTVRGGHLLSAWLTVGDKKNICDDAIGTGCQPSDPANIAAEWGRSATDERIRLVMSGMFRLPKQISLAPYLEYGSGQPWNRLLGYDYNFDFWFSDRLAGVNRNDQDGPPFRVFNLRASKVFTLGGTDSLELILDVFNLFDTTNYDVTSVDQAMFFQGPALFDPSASYVANPRFGTYLDTHDPREVRLGLRYRF